MNRREWLKTMAMASASIYISPLLQACSTTPKTLLLVSGWQDVNIGDIAHTPGLLHVLQTYLPHTTIILWKKSKNPEVEDMLKHAFPKVRIIYGEVDREEITIDSSPVMNAFEQADILVHGSGPGLAGRYHIDAWMKYTTKPYGIFAITIGSTNEHLNNIFRRASFVYTRETASLKVLEEAGITGEHIRFAPDATFYFNLHDTNRASRCLAEHELEEQKYICVVPRLRIAPYHRMTPPRKHWMGISEEVIDTTNEEYKEKDHAKLREAMIAWVRETGNKVLVCPEMTYQVDIMDELLIDPLPDDVKPFVVKRGYWMPDEAASVYKAAFAVLSFECHSPILAAANGTPFFYLRQPEDTIKGQMYYDLGFNDWVFEIEQTQGTQLATSLLNIWKDYSAAKEKVASVMTDISRIYQNACKKIQIK